MGSMKCTSSAALVLTLAFIAGCGGNSAQKKNDQFKADMRSWNQCRASSSWQTLDQLYAICGPIPSIPSP
jgi:hypothetical protein